MAGCRQVDLLLCPVGRYAPPAPPPRHEVPMEEADLLALARAMPECVQSSHFGTTDFRVRNKIFCTFPKRGEMVLKLTPDQQQMLVATEGDIFAPLSHKWGQLGWTVARIAKLDRKTARS